MSELQLPLALTALLIPLTSGLRQAVNNRGKTRGPHLPDTPSPDSAINSKRPVMS